MEAKGAKGAQVGPVLEGSEGSPCSSSASPTRELVARLALLQREHPASTLRAVACPAADNAAAAPQGTPQAARK